MKRYKLLKDLPTFKAGDEFFISEQGNLIAGTPEKPKRVLIGDGDFITATKVDLMAYAKETLEQFPNILTDWFKEIKEPKRIYYANDFGCNVANMTENNNSIIRKSLKSVGNHFETYEEAKAYLEYLKAKTIIKQDTKGFKPDWNNPSQKKIFGYYNIVDKKLCHFNAGENIESKLYFKTEEDIEESFKKHSKEWKTYLTYRQ